MAFWNKKDSASSQLTNSYMVMYVSSYQSYRTALKSNGYPLEDRDEDILKQAHDELLFTILVAHFNDNSQALDDIQTLLVWFIRSRLVADNTSTTDQQVVKYLDNVNSAVNDNIWLRNEGYALESVALTALNIKINPDKEALKPLVPSITSALKKYIEDTLDAFDNEQGLRAVAVELKQPNAMNP